MKAPIGTLQCVDLELQYAQFRSKLKTLAYPITAQSMWSET